MTTSNKLVMLDNTVTFRELIDRAFKSANTEIETSMEVFLQKERDLPALIKTIVFASSVKDTLNLLASKLSYVNAAMSPKDELLLDKEVLDTFDSFKENSELTKKAHNMLKESGSLGRPISIEDLFGVPVDNEIITRENTENSTLH